MGLRARVNGRLAVGQWGVEYAFEGDSCEEVFAAMDALREKVEREHETFLRESLAEREGVKAYREALP